MIIKGLTRQGEYYDSVSLMIISGKISELPGVEDCSVVMGTHENISILKAAGLYTDVFDGTDDTDLLISIKTESEEAFENALKEIEVLFDNMGKSDDDGGDYSPKSLENAVKQMPDANLSIISIAGKYAVAEAWKALKNGLHVMIFSDNISIEDENALKTYGLEKDLLVMGPDCGTAIINGIPLAFANIVNKGNIGIVAASGTGLQEVSAIISNNGGGISQAIGTGGRDVKKEIGGKMFLRGIDAVNEDDNTDVIVLVSKPPHESVQKAVAEKIKDFKKPVVSILIGGDAKVLEDAGAISANTLEEAALTAVALAKGEKPSVNTGLSDAEKQIAEQETAIKKDGQKYLRGLYSGGTLCDETQLIFKEKIGYVYSNTPLSEDFLLPDVWKSQKNVVLDLGDDEFTAGRPHPMIDFSLRKKRIVHEAEDKETAVILMDVVLGYGANLDPAKELVGAIKEAKEKSPGISVICTILGTDKDPQNKQYVADELKKAGAIIFSSNASAARVAAKIIENLK